MAENIPIKEKKKGEKEEELPNPDIQLSIRQLPKMEIVDDEKGEKLQTFMDHEWDASDEPFSAELLNVKNAPNKISVFSGPFRAKDAIETIKKVKPAVHKDAPPVDNRPDRLAQMMSRILSEITDGKDISKIKVTITPEM